MKAEKIRNLTDVELKHQERDLADQLFKLKFQMNMGQTESLKKIRGLRRDIARVQTIRRERVSVLVSVPVAHVARDTSFAKPGDRKVACEPVVSVLTEVAKQLQPGRCVT